MSQAADDVPPRQDLTTLESYQAAIISSFLADKRWKCVFSSISCMIVSRCSPAGESQFTSFPPTSKSQLTPRWKAVSPTSCGWKFQICCTCDHPLQQKRVLYHLYQWYIATALQLLEEVGVKWLLSRAAEKKRKIIGGKCCWIFQ